MLRCQKKSVCTRAKGCQGDVRNSLGGRAGSVYAEFGLAQSVLAAGLKKLKLHSVRNFSFGWAYFAKYVSNAVVSVAKSG